MSEPVYHLLRLGLALLGAFLSMVWIALVLWVYRDAQNRSDRFLVTLLSTALVTGTFIVGWTIYLLLRPELTMAESYQRRLRDRQGILAASEGDLCARCSTRLHLDYRLCPNCGLEVKQPCEVCKRPVRTSWNLCPYCGHSRKRPNPARNSRPS